MASDPSPDWPPYAPADAGYDGEHSSTGNGRANGTSVATATPAPVGISPLAILHRWRTEGPLVRLSTGIDELDRLCRGGLPVPWRMIIVGAPGAGKTFEQISIGNHLARGALESGACVGILAVDEDPEDVTVRLCQIAGFTVAEAEKREPEVLGEMARSLDGLRIRLYDAQHTIEAAARDLAEWSREIGARPALLIDSLQAVTSELGTGAEGPRETVEANVKAMRWASTSLRMLVIATSEANRNSYRNNSSTDQNDLAAGAESRAIEYGAQTQLVLRTPKDHGDVIHVTVPKNRRAHRGEFWLRLDRERHTLTECDDPAKDPEAEEDREEARRAAAKRCVYQDAREVARVFAGRPAGVSVREFRSQIRAAGIVMSNTRVDAAKAKLEQGIDGMRLVNRGNEHRPKWVLTSSEGDA